MSYKPPSQLPLVKSVHAARIRDALGTVRHAHRLPVSLLLFFDEYLGPPERIIDLDTGAPLQQDVPQTEPMVQW